MIERGEIYRRVWGYEMAHGDRSVDVFVRKLRPKIEKRSPGWYYIHTHFGIGYRFEAEPLGGELRSRLRPRGGARLGLAGRRRLSEPARSPAKR